MAGTKKKSDTDSVEETSSISFEEAMKRLEEIANKLENGQATLDESLLLYEQGIALIRLCTEKLDRAEQKIRVLGSDTGLSDS